MNLWANGSFSYKSEIAISDVTLPSCSGQPPPRKEIKKESDFLGHPPIVWYLNLFLSNDPSTRCFRIFD